MLYAIRIRSMQSGYQHVLASENKDCIVDLERIFEAESQGEDVLADFENTMDIYRSDISIIREIDWRHVIDQQNNYDDGVRYIPLLNFLPYDTYCFF